MYRIQKEFEIKKNILEALTVLFLVFKNHDHELYLVGGCVRDLLLGREPKDYDLCTNLLPEEVKDLLKDSEYFATTAETKKRYSFIDTGLKHGTITVHDHAKDVLFEITTYRVDGNYLDNRHPEKVTFTKSLEEDLKRRDFTINSFAYDLITREVLMLEKSFIYDLDFKIIRTVGDPTERFKEDALRMLRAIRFSAQLNFSIDELTYSALSMCAPLMKNISKERIRDELTKILLSDNPQRLEFVVTTGLEQYMFDGATRITDMVKCEHQNPWHYTTVFHHTMDVIKGVPKNFISRWSALFHDIGKPVVKKLKPGTKDHYRYIGHPEESAKIALNLMDILKFSNDQKVIIYKFVLYHDYPLSVVNNKKFKKMIVEIGEDNFIDFLLLKQADGLAHNLDNSTSFAINAVSKSKDRFIQYLMRPQPLRIKDLALNGDDIVKDGFLQGKEIGDCLNWMLEIVLEHPEYNTREKLLEYLQMFKEMSFQNS